MTSITLNANLAALSNHQLCALADFIRAFTPSDENFTPVEINEQRDLFKDISFTPAPDPRLENPQHLFKNQSAHTDTVLPSTKLEPLLEVSHDIQEGDNVEVDAEGVEWDAKIHSQTMRKNANGTWRKLRQVEQSKGTLTELKKELEEEEETFFTLIPKLTNWMESRKIDRATVLKILAANGVPSIPALQHVDSAKIKRVSKEIELVAGTNQL